MENQKRKTYGAVFVQVPLEDGANKEHLTALLDLIGDNVGVVPINISENNGTACGFVREDILMNIEEEVLIAFVSEILDDTEKETESGDYTLTHTGQSVSIFLGYENHAVFEKQPNLDQKVISDMIHELRNHRELEKDKDEENPRWMTNEFNLYPDEMRLVKKFGIEIN